MATTLLQFSPLHNEPPSSNYATLDTDNSTPVLDFSGAGTNESALFSAVMPQAYASGTLTAVLYVTNDGTTGNMDWDVSVEAIASGEDMGADSFDTVNSVDNTNVAGTAGLQTIITVTLANKDSIAAGERIRLKVTRDTAADTNTDDCQLWHMEIQEA